MEFETMRIRDIHAVLRYTADARQWTAKNRKSHIIGIQMTGEALHDFGDRRIHLAAGCVFFFNQREDYAVRVGQRGESYSVHFTTWEPVDTPSFCRKIPNDAQAVRLIGQIDRLWQRDRRGGLAVMEQFYRFCALVDALRSRPYAPRDARAAAARDYLDMNFKEEGCLDGAARVCGVSRRRFNDIFRACFGVTPNRYVVAKKIDLARRLLMLGGLSVAAVASLSGFSDPYYFSRVFAAEVGVAPSRYMRGS